MAQGVARSNGWLVARAGTTTVIRVRGIDVLTGVRTPQRVKLAFSAEKSAHTVDFFVSRDRSLNQGGTTGIPFSSLTEVGIL